MYAMLTGNLPFTVDPFNIKTLYNKMISGQMNPIPDNLSQGKKQFLQVKIFSIRSVYSWY